MRRFIIMALALCAMAIPAAAQASMRGDFAYGISAPRHAWVKCPTVERFSGTNLCMSEFKVYGYWFLFLGSVEHGRANVSYRHSWKRHWHSTRCEMHALRLPGSLMSNNMPDCPALMASDLADALRRHKHPRYAYAHGTNTAGFTRWARYRCHHSRRMIACRNGLGDAFRWYPHGRKRHATLARHDCGNLGSTEDGTYGWTQETIYGAGIFNVESYGVTCQTARNMSKHAYPHDPHNRYPAWHCVYLKHRYEYAKIRCRNGKAWVRWQTGA